MAAAKNMSRLEANREVRRIFVKHGVDTNKLHFSCQGKTVFLTGDLLKDGGQDIEQKHIEMILFDLERLGIRINCELGNWTISPGTISKKGAAPAATSKQTETTEKSSVQQQKTERKIS